MKVRVAFSICVLFKVGLVTADAPYPPSGYQPPGPKFELPQNQYGPPPSITSVSSLPNLPATDFKHNDNDSRQNGNNPVYRNVYEQEDSSRPQQKSLVRNGNPIAQHNQFDRNSFILNNEQYGQPLLQRERSNNNLHYNTAKQYGTIRPQNQDTKQTDIYERNRNQYYINTKGYQLPVNLNRNNDFSRDADDDDTVSINNPNYLPPSTTEALVRRTLDNPNRKESVDSQEDSMDSSVAISTAFAKDRYQLLQSNKNLDRFNYPSLQIQRLTDNNAKLVYHQNPASILGPIYTYSGYSAPMTLIRLY
ncbi:hypothetical protein FQR65_LT11120 [Abscondita terminalis]|nr:hypothetical protein FQR65_LT11120 [Abscondita terminalis]